MGLYDDVKNIPKGSIGDEAIVRSALIKSISFYRERINATRIIKTTCVIHLDVFAIDYGVSGEMDAINTIGIHTVHENDYDLEYEKNVAFSKALEQVQNFKIVLLESDNNPIVVTDIDVDSDNNEEVTSKISFVLDAPLRSLPNGTCDTLEFREGQVIVTRNCCEITLCGDNEAESWNCYEGYENTVLYYVTMANITTKKTSNPFDDGAILSDRLPSISFSDAYEDKGIEGISIDDYGDIDIVINKSRLPEISDEAIMQWIQTNNITLVCGLKEPTIEVIDIADTLTLYKGGNVTVESKGELISGTVHIIKNDDTQRTVIDMNGQTLVNLWGSRAEDFKLSANATFSSTYNSGFVTVTANGEKVDFYSKKVELFKPSTNYTIIVNVIENTLDGITKITSDEVGDLAIFSEEKIINNNEIGTFTFNITTKDNFDGCLYSLRSFVDSGCTSGSIKLNIVVLEGDFTNAPINYFKGLQSANPTKVVSCEGDKENSITLPSIQPLRSLPNGVCDNAEINGNKLTITRKVGKITLNGSESWKKQETLSSTNSTFTLASTLASSSIANDVVSMYCDSMVARSSSEVLQNAIVGISSRQIGVGGFALTIENNKLSALTLTAFKNYLALNPLVVVYQRATSIIENYDIDEFQVYENGDIYAECSLVPVEDISTHEISVPVPDTEINNVGNHFNVGFDSEGNEYLVDEEFNARLIIKGNTIKKNDKLDSVANKIEIISVKP